MTKQISIVYQDCPTCGARKEWGESTIKAAINAKAQIRKVSFVTREGEQLIAKAVEKGITRMPFVTDGTTFAYDIKSVLEAESEAHSDKKEAKTIKKSKKVKAEIENESN